MDSTVRLNVVAVARSTMVVELGLWQPERELKTKVRWLMYRQMLGEDLERLGLKDLEALESRLEVALAQARHRKSYVSILYLRLPPGFRRFYEERKLIIMTCWMKV
ncbi:hypothetical protein Droror1_Dr00002455 [Drosera rotundifolia]